jgi:nicotinate-nucleotide adenylyltransferase
MKLALFGGTFDPIHSAHLAVAREAADHFQLDRVLFIPNAIPPHKHRKVTAPFEHRFQMVELACQADPRFEASLLEQGREKSYSILTIERVAAQLPAGSRLYFLIGADAFSEIETWFRWRDVLAAVEFIVLSRPGFAYRIPEGARVHKLESLAMTISSTAIRAALAKGRRDEGLPAVVADYIEASGLYGFPAPVPRAGAQI